jgi:hypothetical protein
MTFLTVSAQAALPGDGADGKRLHLNDRFYRFQWRAP